MSRPVSAYVRATGSYVQIDPSVALAIVRKPRKYTSPVDET
jgi:hypothetical protein